MPQCSKCPTKQSKLNIGDLCTSCHRKGKDHDDEDSAQTQTTMSEIAGVSLSDIEALPDLAFADMNQPLTTGAMLKIIAGAMKPIHDRLDDHEKRIIKLEEGQKETAETVQKVENESKNAEKRLTVTETKIKNLEEKNDKLKKVVIKQQSQIAIQEKNIRLRNVVIGGLDEEKDLSVNNNAASTDNQKVKLILSALNLDHIDFVRCRRTGNQDQGPQKRPRFLIVEFSKPSDRNEVKASGSQLQGIPELKDIRIKADLTKDERAEYKRLYDLRDQLSKDNPGKVAIVDKGVVKLDGQEIDKYKTPSSGF